MKRPGKSKKQVRRGSVLDRLNAGEAQTVLRHLLETHKDLREEAEQMALTVLGDVSFEGVAEEVEFALGNVSTEELYGRAGRHEDGYVEPGEAAWQFLEEKMEPFLEEIGRYFSLGMKEQALQVCQGIVLGLYRFSKERENEVLDWTPDFPVEMAGLAVSQWKELATKQNRRPQAFPQEFIQKWVIEWKWLNE